MQKIVVVYDACVLYPAPLRDLLMYLAMTGLYQAKWTNQIHDEWIRNILANRTDLKRAQLERTKNLMNQHILDCLVEGYERLIPSLKLPDPDDRHVLAEAIHSSATIILTYNLRDFPTSSLSKYNIIAQHPDKFLTQLLSIQPDMVCAAVKKQRMNLKNPPLNIKQYLAILEKLLLPNFVKNLEHFVNLL